MLCSLIGLCAPFFAASQGPVDVPPERNAALADVFEQRHQAPPHPSNSSAAALLQRVVERTSTASHPPPCAAIAPAGRIAHALYAGSLPLFLAEALEVIPEARLMLEAAETTTEGPRADTPPSDAWSLQLTGQFTIELERALGGLVAFFHVVGGTPQDYEALVAAQPQAQRLSKTSFAQLHALTRQATSDTDRLFALTWAILCNDLGKVHEVRRYAAEKSSSNYAREVDHDQLLGYLLEADQKYFSGFTKLSAVYQQQIRQGFLSGSDIAQFSHLETPAASLIGLRKLGTQTRELYFLHSLFDVAGAAAHRNKNGSLTLTEPTWQIFSDVSQALELFKDSHSTETSVFVDYAQRRGRRISMAAQEADRMPLQILAAMQRLTTSEEGQTLQQAWDLLGTKQQSVLRDELDLYTLRQPASRAIRISYGPTTMLNLRNKKASGTSEAQSMADGLSMLAELFVVGRKQLESLSCSASESVEPFLIDARLVAAAVRDQANDSPAPTLTNVTCRGAAANL